MTNDVEIPSETIDTTTPKRRSLPGALHIGAAVLATLLLAGMAVFMFGALADRDEAQEERREAAAQLRVERDRAESAEAQLTSVRDGHREGMTTVDALSTRFDELVNLAEREVELATIAQDAGANNSKARVDEYNDVTSRGNEVIEQYNARLAELEERIRTTVPDATTTA